MAGRQDSGFDNTTGPADGAPGLEGYARSIVETVREPLLILAGDLRVEAANPPFFRTFRVTPEATLGRYLYDLGDRHWDVPRLRNLLEEVLRDERHFEGFEVEAMFPAIGHKVMLLNARQVVLGPGHPSRILLAIEDVTAERQARDELRRLNRELDRRVRERTSELEAANRELEAFCYSVSHDLRAPLRGIDGFSDELLRSYGDRLDEKGRHYLQRVRAGTQRMGRLIDDLLHLSRISRGQLARGRVDLTALAEAVAAELRQAEPGRDVTFVIEPGLAATGDGPLLRVALENLLGNAWKFTSRKPAATVWFGRTDAGGEPAFCVRDDGAGFDMAHAGKLFGAFQRLHPEREFPGHGIGLATVQRVVRRHGGRVWAESAPGQGAAFYFTLPEEAAP